ncbi:GPR1/FUN34/yaaH family-domain-containing protein [Thamnidium elegans]|nr:GPR1/FUN34/yaaH family-domain-containing protein [Thamnidium elegans]
MSSEHQDVESKYQVTHSSPPPVVAGPAIANPGPLGLCGFALTTFVLSLHNAGAGVRSDGPHGVVTGLAIFYGGLVQLLAGMWEFKTGNTFGATAFSSYGGFWLSFAMIYIPGTDIIGSYGKDADLMNKSVGYFLLGWTIFTGIMLIASHRSNVGLISLFFFLFITFILLTAGKLNHSITCNIAGGALGIVTAFIAWYNALAGLLTKESSYFTLPLGRIN